MALDAPTRSSIFRKLVPVLGEDDANALMSEFPASEADELVTKQFLRAELATEIGSLRPMGVEDDLILEKLLARPGTIQLPIAAGLGVTPDWDRIEQWRPEAQG